MPGLNSLGGWRGSTVPSKKVLRPVVFVNQPTSQPAIQPAIQPHRSNSLRLRKTTLSLVICCQPMGALVLAPLGQVNISELMRPCLLLVLGSELLRSGTASGMANQENKRNVVLLKGASLVDWYEDDYKKLPDLLQNYPPNQKLINAKRLRVFVENWNRLSIGKALVLPSKLLAAPLRCPYQARHLKRS